MLKRLSIFAYGLICYAVFLATFLYALGFVGNFGVPHSIDGEPRMYFSTALLIDLTLLGIFAIQHSLMARPYFKRWLTQFIPASAERSTYVLFSSVALIALFAWWEPIGGMVWDVADPAWRVVLYALFAFGWGWCCSRPSSSTTSTCSDCARSGCSCAASRTRPCNSARRDLTSWSGIRCISAGSSRSGRRPTMSVTHLVFALATTAYILIAIQLEERDLIEALGDDYRQYRERVPMIIPFREPQGPGGSRKLPGDRACLKSAIYKRG